MSRSVKRNYDKMNTANRKTAVARHYNAVHHKLCPQARKVFSYLRSKESITAQDAERSPELAGIVGGALTSRISELRAVGFHIRRETKVDPVTRRRYSRYWLEDTVTETNAT